MTDRNEARILSFSARTRLGALVCPDKSKQREAYEEHRLDAYCETTMNPFTIQQGRSRRRRSDSEIGEGKLPEVRAHNAPPSPSPPHYLLSHAARPLMVTPLHTARSTSTAAPPAACRGEAATAHGQHDRAGTREGEVSGYCVLDRECRVANAAASGSLSSSSSYFPPRPHPVLPLVVFLHRCHRRRCLGRSPSPSPFPRSSFPAAATTFLTSTCYRCSTTRC